MEQVSARGARATIQDVARVAGVSVATVSRALNGREDVAAATRERVRQVATELGFRSNRQPRQVDASALTVGILTSDTVGRVSMPVLLGAENALGAGRVAVLLCDARGDAIREAHYLRILLERRVDGIVVVGEHPEVRSPLAEDLPVPVVYAYAPSSSAHDLSLVADNEEAAYGAVRHLIALGRRRIAHVTGPRGRAAAVEREAGMRRALAEAGLDLHGEVLHGGDWSQRWGRQAAAMVLTGRPDVDAVFCGSDRIAAGALETLREQGRRVPEDVSVVGFDNWDIVATETRPPLSSVDMQLEQLGAEAARHLVQAIAGRSERGVRRLPCRLVLRESTTFAP
ncbi:LacI family DNA-binding transcriptional regulator [Kineococcus sp. SYSU DK006]|uniref:LacI family DNA-binding transcriptional regulator n=1 Tax=Kineococcus sp. SYSU DK006 TaxID=3383127 RepID=UPI003D7E1D8B